MGTETSSTSTRPVSATVPKLRQFPLSGAGHGPASAPVSGAGTGLLTAPAVEPEAVATQARPVSGAGPIPTFRRPGRPGRVYSGADQAPRLRQLMGVCGWAAVLGGVGLVLGLRGFIGILAGQAPPWYEPATTIAGVVGIGLTVGAFLTVHRAKAPWVMLGAASATLATAMVFTSIAF